MVLLQFSDDGLMDGILQRPDRRRICRWVDGSVREDEERPKLIHVQRLMAEDILLGELLGKNLLLGQEDVLPEKLEVVISNGLEIIIDTLAPL